MSTPLISVIIPTYRHRDFVLDTLRSVFEQSLSDFEVIVINDGSPDDTGDLLRPLAQAGQIRLIEQQNAGQGAARNRGINEARGEFIALLDDDDLWPPDKLATQLAVLKRDPAMGVVYGPYELFGDGAKPALSPGPSAPLGWVREDFYRYNYIRSPGQTLIRTRPLREVGGFDEAIWGADDWDLYLRLAAVTQFAYDPNVALRYRMHASNASRDIGRMYANATRVRLKHLGRWPRRGSISTWFASRRFVRMMTYGEYVAAATTCSAAGDWVGAARNWRGAVSVNRAIVFHPRALGRALTANFRSLSISKPSAAP